MSVIHCASWKDSSDDKLPQELVFPHGSYLMEKVLCTTLQGCVSVARKHQSEVVVVVKESDLLLAKSGRACNGLRVAEDVFKEYNIMKRLQSAPHPNVVSLIDGYTDDKKIYEVMEYCEGGDVFSIVQKQRRLSETCAKKYFAQILSGLKHLHDNGICHLDLSLENIFVTEEDFAKIGDFGVAREFRNGDDKYLPSRTFPGKVKYMAPEIFASKAFRGRSADVFSLGVILFIMVFGVEPFEKPSVRCDENFNLIVNRGLDSLLRKCNMESDVSEELVDLLSRMISVEKSRSSLDEVLKHAWIINPAT